MSAAFTADAGKTDAAERRSEVTQKPGVHPSHADVHLSGDSVTAFQIAGPHSSRQSVIGVIGQGNGLFFGVEWNKCRRWSEDFFPHDTIGVTQPRPYCRFDPRSVGKVFT